MKKILLSSAAFFVFLISGQAQDNWSNVVTGGFDHYQNSTVNCMNSFNGMLYAGVGYDSGVVYRSATGSPGTWTRTFSNNSSYSINTIATTGQGGGYMYISSQEFNSDNYVYRSPDGVNWTSYFYTFGLDIPFIIPYAGAGTTDSMYVVKNDYYGSAVFKSAFDSNDPTNSSGTSWATVLDFSNNFPYTYFTGSCVHNNKLYLGTNNSAALLWNTTDGNNWALDSACILTNASGITAMVSFNGDLYIAVDNYVDGPTIWKTHDDTIFTQVISYSGYTSITSMTVANGQLWVAISADIFSAGGEIDKSNDGSTFISSNHDGFGLTYGGNAEGNFTVFNNNLYFGDNYSAAAGRSSMSDDGGQIWRYCLGGTMPSVSLGADQTLCSNTAITLDAGSGLSSYLWCTGETTQTINPSIPGSNDYIVTVSDANNCFNADTVNINLVALPNPAILTPDTIICRGNSVILMAYDSIIDKPAIDFRADYAYLKSGDYTPLMSSIDESMTIEMWFKTNTQGVLLAEQDSAGYWYDNQLEIDASGDVYGQVSGIGSIFIGNAPFGSWNHVVLRYNKSLFLLDGFLNGVGSVTNYSGDRYAPWEYGYSQGYNIGASSYSYITTSDPFNGLIRDIRIWNYALPDANIISNMNSIVAPNSLGLVANYLCNEGSGMYAYDHSINGLTDTLKNGSITGSQFVLPPVYTWSPAAGLNTVTGDTVIASPTVTTTYTVSSTNAFGCSNSSQVTVNVPQVSISPVSDTVCLFAPIIYTNTGTGPDSAKWYVDGTLWSTALSFTNNPITTGLQSITLIGYTSTCVDSAFASLLVNPNPASTATSAQSLCYGDTVTLADTVSGGTPPYTYLWSDGTNTYTSPIISVPTLLSVGLNVTATDVNGCTTNSTTSVTAIPLTDIYGHVTYSGGAITQASVKLYRYENQLTKFNLIDSVRVNPVTGIYHFTGVYHSEYLIKVFADTAVYPALVPTYYGNVFLWTSATHVFHNCSTIDTLDVIMTEQITTPPGTGFLRGRITEDFGFGRNIGDPVPSIDVKVGHNPGGQMVGSTTTSLLTAPDLGGYYYFTNLDTGSYTVYVDIPGLGRDSSYTISITPATPSYSYLDYTVDSAMIRIVPNAGAGISNPEIANANSFGVYPNPSRGNTTIEYTIAKDADISLKVYNVLGTDVQSLVSTKQTSGKYSYQLHNDTDNRRAGVYFISLTIDGKTTTQRLVVIE